MTTRKQQLEMKMVFMAKFAVKYKISRPEFLDMAGEHYDLAFAAKLTKSKSSSKSQIIVKLPVKRLNC